MMKIATVEAFPLSAAVNNTVTLGIGTMARRDTVLVRVETEDGCVGFGESHHGRSAGSIADIINNLLRFFVVGHDSDDVVGLWQRIYTMQLRSHGMGAAAAIAMSGIDQALWDIRAKRAGLPLYRYLGGASRPINAYAGGISLGWVDPAALVEEVADAAKLGYRAFKLRGGDTPVRDVARVQAVRERFGDTIEIMVDANTAYSATDFDRVSGAFAEADLVWLEEPFAPHDHNRYRDAAARSSLRLAAGENHYTRFEFVPLIESGAVHFMQPDLSKTGGLTEALRIAAHASAYKLPVCPHTSTTAVNMAITVHFLAAIENAGYFEGDIAVENPFRDQLGSQPYTVDPQGCVLPLERPGIGIEIDMDFVREHPFTPGLAYREA